MDPQYWIMGSYVIGTITGWFLFASTNREFMVGQTLAVLAKQGVIAVEETDDGDLSVSAIPAVDTDEIVNKLIAELEELQEQSKKLSKDNEEES